MSVCSILHWQVLTPPHIKWVQHLWCVPFLHQCIFIIHGLTNEGMSWKKLEFFSMGPRTSCSKERIHVISSEPINKRITSKSVHELSKKSVWIDVIGWSCWEMTFQLCDSSELGCRLFWWIRGNRNVYIKVTEIGNVTRNDWRGDTYEFLSVR